MMGLEVAADMAGMWQESVQNVTTGISGLGASELAQTTQKAADALDVMAGSMQIVSVAASLMTTVNAAQTAKAVAGIAARSWNPVGWANIALAFGAAALAAGVTYGITRNYKLKADLSDPSQVQAVVQQIGVLA